MVTKAVITTLDNLPNLQESVDVLLQEPVDRVVVVNNGSQDGTREWLDSITRCVQTCRHRSFSSIDSTMAREKVHVIHHENRGAGPGRNAGLDAAGEFDFVLMLDGGIRPLVGGTARMLDYLQHCRQADVIGIEIPHFETDAEKAWRRWPDPILDEHTYVNTRLSQTAYCLARRRAFDGLRFCEDGPFGEPGWGCDDDEMCYQWNEEGIEIHVVTNIHPYRRASGSFHRLYRETGIYPNQYGSVYEKRLVWLQQNWPQYSPGVQWGEPWMTVVIEAEGVEATARMIKAAHDLLRQRAHGKPYGHIPHPYSIIVWGGDEEWLVWAEPRRLRQHHGDTIVLDEYGPGRQIVKRGGSNADAWAGDFRLWPGDDWAQAVRPGPRYYGLVRDQGQLGNLIDEYNRIHPEQGPPMERKEIMKGAEDG